MPRPSFKTFSELPISVRHAWDGYVVVDQALERLEQGQFQEAALLADAVFTDDRVAGCLATRINGLFGLPMEFRYPGQTEANARAKPVNEAAPTLGVGGETEDPRVLELKQHIAEQARLNWEKMFPSAAAREQMRWGLLLNAGLGELIWDWGADGLIWPTLRTWNTQFLYWRWDTRSYWLIHQDGQEEIHAGDGRWVVLSPFGHNHGWLYGLIRPLAKLWMDRTFAWRDWARASEKYSLGIIKGKVPANASEEDKNRFSSSMTNLPNESFVLLPQGDSEQSSFDAEMMQTDSAVNWQSFKERFNQLDTSIAILILGQNLSTDVQGGSRAAAQVHDNVRGDFLKADDQIWATTIRTQVLTPWVIFNWGDIISELGREVSEFVPEVRHQVEPADDKYKQALSIAQIAYAMPGLAGTDADIHAILEQAGIPTINQDGPRNGEQAPPGADVNERPPPPETSEDVLRLLRVQLRGAPKLGAIKGRVRIDEVVDAAKKAGAQALAARKAALLHICRADTSYEEKRRQIKRLYSDLKPSQLREILEKTMMVSQLLGQMTAAVDNHHG